MDIKNIVERLTSRHRSRNPFTIAENLGIILLYPNLTGTLGFYSYYKRSKCIHISSVVPRQMRYFVCGHELGHAVLHPHENTPFLKRHTLFSTDKLERQANAFAVELLLPDSLLQEYANCSVTNIAKRQGIPGKLITLKNFTP